MQSSGFHVIHGMFDFKIPICILLVHSNDKIKGKGPWKSRTLRLILEPAISAPILGFAGPLAGNVQPAAPVRNVVMWRCIAQPNGKKCIHMEIISRLSMVKGIVTLMEHLAAKGPKFWPRMIAFVVRVPD
jgi:hypothetical protein